MNVDFSILNCYNWCGMNEIIVRELQNMNIDYDYITEIRSKDGGQEKETLFPVGLMIPSAGKKR